MEQDNLEGQKKISKFVELSLLLILKGFDEMEMQKRLELIKLLKFIVTNEVDKTYNKINKLESRIERLENKDQEMENTRIIRSNQRNQVRF